jgi:DNA/RNA-binding domain of Phe-tRNA-synthetase-like protein
VHLAGRFVLADDRGPFGNPTSDSARTMVTEKTVSVMVAIYAPKTLTQAALERVIDTTKSRIAEYCVPRT